MMNIRNQVARILDELLGEEMTDKQLRIVKAAKKVDRKIDRSWDHRSLTDVAYTRKTRKFLGGKSSE